MRHYWDRPAVLGTVLALVLWAAADRTCAAKVDKAPELQKILNVVDSLKQNGQMARAAVLLDSAVVMGGGRGRKIIGPLDVGTGGHVGDEGREREGIILALRSYGGRPPIG